MLKVEKLAAQISGRPVFRDVSFELVGGEFAAIIGANGAGKTTLLRSIVGLQPLSEGVVSVAYSAGTESGAATAGTGSGRSVLRKSTQIGYVPQRQEFAWDFPVMVFDAVLAGLVPQIGFFKRARKQHFEAVTKTLRMTGLDTLANRQVGALSGGQRQRVLIARALVTAPTVLLLDEPFTGLDLPTADNLMQLLRQLANTGTAVLMTTHDIVAAQASCDRLLLLRETLLADAHPAQLTDSALWQEVFRIADTHPLLKALGVTA